MVFFKKRTAIHASGKVDKTDKETQLVRAPQISKKIFDMKVNSIAVKKGELVNIGDCLLTLEADKTSFDILSKCSGIIRSITCKKGQAIRTGEVLLKINIAQK